MPDAHDRLLQATDRLQQARRAFAQGEHGLAMLHRSRTAFIHSLRNTGLSYAQARIKYDNCLEAQQRLHEQTRQQLQFAEQLHQSLSNAAPGPASAAAPA